MAKKNNSKGRKKTPVELPPILSAGIAVPVLAGFAIVAGITQSVPFGILGAIAGGALYWAYLNSSFTFMKKAVVPTKTPDDIVLNTMEEYTFVKAAETDDPRPEAYSLDGLRWSHKLKFETEDGETDIFVIRGSLVTGEGYLEFVPDESTRKPEEWLSE